MSRQARTSRTAFTLIELVATIIVLGIAMGLIAPRLVSTASRRAEAEARAIASMLSVVAQRDALGGDRLAIEYDRKTSEIRLMALRTRGDDAWWSQAAWIPDPFVRPIALDTIELDEARFDGRPADPAGWRWTIISAEPRGLVECIVRTRDGVSPARGWVISLLPHATEARMLPIGASTDLAADALHSVDLDAEGEGDRPW